MLFHWPGTQARLLIIAALTLAAVTLVAAGSLEAAAVFRVPGEFPDLARTLALAVPGDSVLVGPGQYEGRFILPAGVVLVSTAGADSTILWPSFIMGIEVEGKAEGTVIRGFTLNCWRGAEIGIRTAEGSALIEKNVIVKSFDGIQCTGGEVTIRENRIEGCRRGIALTATNPLVEDNVLAGNSTAIDLTSASPVIQRNRIELSRTGVSLELYSYPVIGGGLNRANDFLRNGTNLANRTMSTVGLTRMQDQAVVTAKYNYWGTLCPPPEKFIGQCRIKPWTDESHLGKYTECPPEADTAQGRAESDTTGTAGTRAGGH